LSTTGTLNGEELIAGLATDNAGFEAKRYFIDCPLHGNERSYVLSNGWGKDTENALEELVKLAPHGSTFSYRPSEPALE
jgi:hypothetical protein